MQAQERLPLLDRICILSNVRILRVIVVVDLLWTDLVVWGLCMIREGVGWVRDWRSVWVYQNSRSRLTELIYNLARRDRNPQGRLHTVLSLYVSEGIQDLPSIRVREVFRVKHKENLFEV